MSKILSQEEIDALLSTVAPVEKESSAEQLSPDTQLYDFKHPERISKEQIRSLKTIHDNFARLFATYLSTNMRTLVDVNLLSIDQVTFSEYSLSLSVPNCLYMLEMESLEGKALFEISPQFILFVVDRLLGGYGETDTEVREISQIERNVVSRVIQTAISHLNEVWRQIYDLNAKLAGFESDPQFVQIARSSDTLAIIFFDIRVRGATYTMNLALPYFTLEPVINRLSMQSMMAMTFRKSEAGEGELMHQRLQTTNLPVQAVLAETTMKVRDFIELKEDDIIRLNKPTDDLVEVRFGGKPKLFGNVANMRNRRVIKVVRRVTPDEELIYG